MADSPPNTRTLPGNPGAAVRRAAPRITEEPQQEPLVVLSDDAALLAALKKIAAPRPVRTVARDADLSLTLREAPSAVAILDSDCITRAPLARLTARLKLQFPDIAVVVLAQPQDYRELADQLTRDTIYGFLEKPAQPQRLQQMLARAWLRHGTAEKVWEGPPKLIERLQRPLTLGLIAACLMAAVAGGAYGLRTWARSYGTPAQAVTPLPAESPAAQLLTRADAAVAAGAYENAAELYRRAQQIAPGDPRVAKGVAVLIRRLLAASQTQLLDQHLDRAQASAKLAVELQPDNPLVTQLVTQISGLQSKAAASAQNAPNGPNAPQNTAAMMGLEDLLPHAFELMRQGHLIDPPQDNAHAAVVRARQIAPSDPRVGQLQKQLVQLMLAAGRRAAAAGHPEELLRYVGPVQDLGAPASEVARMESSDSSRSGAPGNQPLLRLAAAFNERLQQGKLVQPANDSAKFYLAQLMKSAPKSPVGQIARLALGQRLTAEAQSAVRRQDGLAARRWLTEARDAGVDASSIATIEASLAAAQAAPPAPDHGSLKQIRYVSPDYPAAALSHKVKGSVDVQFTVRTDGTTGDFTVTSATPTGVFEQAALKAVSQWRYQPPVLKDGTPTQVRAVVKLDFAPY